LVVPNQGTYTVNTTTGSISFTPLASFTGTASPITYSVADNYGQKAATTYTPAVDLPLPATASPDTSTGPYGAPQLIRALNNDAATQGQTFDVATVVLCDPNTVPAEMPPSCSALVVSVADGTYTVDTFSGSVNFQPVATFSGVAQSVRYQVTDTTGVVAHSRITPTVLPFFVAPTPAPEPPRPVRPPVVIPDVPVEPEPVLPPKANPDLKLGKLNKNIVLTPATNDNAGSFSLSPTSIVLCNGSCVVAGPILQTQVVSTPQGKWSIQSGSSVVTFTPNWNWHGTTKISYVIFDSFGQRATSTITVAIGAPPLPKVLVYTGVGPKIMASTSPSIPKLPVALKERDHIATITAPRLGAKWSHKIFEGTSIKNVLDPLGLGHYSMTQLPGEAGNFAVAGHRLGSGGIFKNLHTFKKGDVVTVKTAKGTFKYRYLAKKYVKPSMVGVLLPNPTGLTVKPKSGSLLTLQTCTAGDSKQDRLIVWFELIG
jgi:LPXTG-site transpeptidase (sortase) family protein